MWEDPSPVILSWWTFSCTSVRLGSSFNIHSFNKCVQNGSDVPGITLNTWEPAENEPDPWKHARPDIDVLCLTWRGMGGSNQVLIWLWGKQGEFTSPMATCLLCADLHFFISGLETPLKHANDIPIQRQKTMPSATRLSASARSFLPQFMLTLTFYPRSTALPMIGFLVPAFRQSVCGQWLYHILSALQSVFNKVKTQKTAKNTRADGTWEITWFSCFFWQMGKTQAQRGAVTHQGLHSWNLMFLEPESMGSQLPISVWSFIPCSHSKKGSSYI